MSRIKRAWQELMRPDMEPELHLRLWPYGSTHAIEGPLRDIALSLKHLDRKTRARPQRVIECKHPELHPEQAS